MEGHKTLNEVINVLDKCFGDDRYNIVPLECDPDYGKEALRYLKEYKNTDENYKIAIAHVIEVIDHYEKMVADYLAENNPPLTWDELKAMEGKPVWVEYGTFSDSGWALISEISEQGCIEFLLPWGLRLVMHEGAIGKTWQAYRKERTE